MLKLEEITDEDKERVGLPAYDMSRLMRGSIPIPVSFCVTADPLKAVAEKLGLDDMEKRLAALPPDSPKVASAAKEMQKSIRDHGIGDDLHSELEAAASGFDYMLLEVTLSPVVASYEAAAIAGLKWNGRYLPVGSIADAVLECWTAPWSARALGFRLRLGMEPGSVGAAVYVAEAKPAPLEGRIIPSGEEEDAWIIQTDPRVRGPRDLLKEKTESGKLPSPLTSSQAEALTILAEGAAEILGEPRRLTWTFEGSRFTITGLPYG